MASDVTPATIPTRTRAPQLAFGPYVFDPNRRLLRRGDSEVPLPPRVLGVLELLLGRAGDVVARQELIDTVWKDAFVTDTSLAEAVSYLRQTLADDPQAPRFIQTVHRRGYRFVSPVEELTAPAAPDVRLASSAAPENGPPAGQRDEQVRPSIANELLPWSLAILSFVAALSAMWYATGRKPALLPIVTVPIELMPGEQFDSRAPALAISPSGTRIAWSACRYDRCDLYVRGLQHLGANRLAGTEGASAPFFSPDELWIGFFADGKLKKVFVHGGGAITITEAPQPFGGAWLGDGTIVFAASAAGGLMRVDEDGGPPAPLTTPSAASGEVSHAYPSPAPDGKGVIFTIRTTPVASAPGRLALLPHARSEQASWKILVDRADIGGAVGKEFLAFLRHGNLTAVPFDAVRQSAAGVPQVLEGSMIAPHLAVSGSGAMAVVGVHWVDSSTPHAPMWEWNLRDMPRPDGLPRLHQPTLSPDARSLAGIDTESMTDVWTISLDRGTSVRLTHSAPNAQPVWSADASTVFYASRRQGPFEIWSRNATGGGDATKVFGRDGRNVFPSSVSERGDIAFVETGGSTRSDVGIFRPATSDTQMIAQTSFDDTAPAISRDATMLAYQGDESGRSEITLVRLRDASRQVVSRGGGVRPFWSYDGRVLYFEHDDDLMLVKVDPASGTIGPPIAVSRLNGAHAVGIAPSGAVLLHRPADPTLRIDSATMTVNWIEHLRRTLIPPMPTTPR